eukprot:4495606-Pleurochrysis_carterae.AAC.3
MLRIWCPSSRRTSRPSISAGACGASCAPSSRRWQPTASQRPACGGSSSPKDGTGRRQTPLLTTIIAINGDEGELVPIIMRAGFVIESETSERQVQDILS